MKFLVFFLQKNLSILRKYFYLLHEIPFTKVDQMTELTVATNQIFQVKHLHPISYVF